MILSIYHASARRDTHVAPLGLWIKQDPRPTRVCMQFRWGIWGRHALPYTLRSSGGQGLEGSSSIDIPLLWSEKHMLPRRGFGSSKISDLRGCVCNFAGVFGVDMLYHIHRAPLEGRDWKDRRSIDIPLLWSEKHMLSRRG